MSTCSRCCTRRGSATTAPARSKFGAAGDFTTAPELSPLFGRCLARAAAPIVGATGGDVLEFGAGSGRLAATLLPALAALGATPRRYLILEVSAELRARQQALLAGLPAALGARVDWLDRPPAAPLSGVVLANEVADALPFSCFAIRAAGPVARGVALDAAGQLAWAERAGRCAPARRARAHRGGHRRRAARRLCLGAVPRGRRVDPDALPRRSGRAPRC